MKTGYIIILYVVCAMVILTMPMVDRLDASASNTEILGADGEYNIPGSVMLPTAEADTPKADTEASLPTYAEAESSVKILLYRNESGETEEIPLEDYVLGVVAAEMPVSFGDEALKAQAIAARTYAAYRIAAGYRHGESEAAVCDSYACCAAYISPSEAALRWGSSNSETIISDISRAVSSTCGKIVLYKDKIALTIWHSNSYEYTKSAENVWGGSEPYLVSVSTLEGRVDSYGGHGVGMSQYGAAEMATRGCSAAEILAHYYPGTAIGTIK